MSTRNFDASALTERTKAQFAARGLFSAQTNGTSSIPNPQTSDGTAARIEMFRAGSESFYYAPLVGGTAGGTIQLGGTVAPSTAPPSAPV